MEIAGGWSPKCPQVNMHIGQISGGQTKKWEGTTRLEVDAHDRGLFRTVAQKRASIRSGYQCSSEAAATIGRGEAVYAQLVLRQIEHHLERAAREYRLPEVVTGVAVVVPKVLDEFAARWPWHIGMKVHPSDTCSCSTVGAPRRLFGS